jgi:tetratricopeptide (TPR) repeat protein
LPKATRADLHAAFADWLEEHGRDLVELDEILGYHLEQAARYRAELGKQDEELASLARARLAAAGGRALARADRAATGLLERAVALLPPGSYDVDLELSLADALFVGGRPGEVAALTDSLANRAEAVGDRSGVLRAKLSAEIVSAYIDPSFRTETLKAHAEEALRELAEAQDLAGMYAAWFGLLTAAHGEMQWGAKLRAAEKALECAEQLGDDRLAALLLPHLVSSRYFGPTPASEVLSWIEESDYRSPALGFHGAQVLGMLGRVEEARAMHEAAHERVKEIGAAVPVAISCNMRAELELMVGDHEAALSWGLEACDRMEAMGHSAWLSTMAAQVGHALFALGRDDEAYEWAEKGRTIGAEDDLATQVHWRRVEAKVLARRGEHAEAEAFAREAVELIGATDMPDALGDALLDLAVVLDLVGKRDEAATTLQHAIDCYEGKENLLMAGRAKAWLDELSLSV